MLAETSPSWCPHRYRSRHSPKSLSAVDDPYKTSYTIGKRVQPHSQRAFPNLRMTSPNGTESLCICRSQHRTGCTEIYCGAYASWQYQDQDLNLVAAPSSMKLVSVAPVSIVCFPPMELLAVSCELRRQHYKLGTSRTHLASWRRSAGHTPTPAPGVPCPLLLLAYHATTSEKSQVLLRVSRIYPQHLPTRPKLLGWDYASNFPYSYFSLQCSDCCKHVQSHCPPKPPRSTSWWLHSCCRCSEVDNLRGSPLTPSAGEHSNFYLT
mmetsp:Transcript_40039/g.89836  ORF Transcript_40039/g.89836 Transcript_40039/m.89836 type:complete len:265 (+) Transcript_40039:1091-1885(+)